MRCLKLAVITLGGERKAWMEEQFAALSEQVKDMCFDVVYLDGVKGAELNTKNGLRSAAAVLLEVNISCEIGLTINSSFCHHLTAT